jgi:hypothetical protein
MAVDASVDELSTPYHPAPAYFDDVAPSDDYMLSDTISDTTCYRMMWRRLYVIRHYKN